MPALIKSFAIKAASLFQTTCLITGMTVVLILGLEASVRVYRSGRAWIAPRLTRLAHQSQQWKSDPAPPGYWDVKVHPDYYAELSAVRHLNWEPYVYSRAQANFNGKYIHTDSIGRRVTPQPAAVPDASGAPPQRSLKVFLMGASTMWGYGQRDAHTIAAEVSRRLQSIVVPGERIEVVNQSQIGYVMTQSVLALLLELRDGNRPDVVVFFDGSNDVAAAMQSGVAGIPQNEFKREADFKLGRALDHHAFDSGLRKDVTAIAILLRQALNQFDVFDAVVQRAARRPAPPQPSHIAAEVARRYTDNARLVSEWGRADGFIPIFVWPPAIQNTEKRLTPSERALLPQHLETNPYVEVYRVLPRMLDSMMAPIAAGRFVNQSGLFKEDSLPIFLDVQGHQTELATPGIADAIWPALRTAVLEQRRRIASTSRATGAAAAMEHRR